MKTKKLIVFPIIFAVLCMMIIPFASAKTVASTGTSSYREVIRDDISTTFILSVEVVHFTMMSDGSSIFTIHTVNSIIIDYGGGFKYSERIEYNNVQNTAAGNGPVYNGEDNEHFVSGGYSFLWHSEYAYSNGQVRVDQYWTKEN